MARSTPLGVVAVALAWLLVLAPASGAAGPGAGTAAAGDRTAGTTGGVVTGASATSPLSTANNTSARLVLPAYRIQQAHFETVTVGLASTLQSGAFVARAEHRRIAIEQEFARADTVDEQRSVVDRALIGARNRIQSLEARERSTIRAYSDGNISTETMVRRLARIDARAREMSDTLERVRHLTGRIPTDDFDTRIRDLQGLLAPLTGPVRERIGRTLSGETTAVRVHVVASEEGLVLSMLVGGQYVREATDWSNRNVSAPRELDFGEITSRVEELYPWVTAQTGGTSVNWQGSSAWRFQASHSQGEIAASVDASTAEIYREVQRLDVDEMPATTTIVQTRDGLRIALQRTYPGGPLRILVEDASTDAVVNANVTVDGHDLGHIGADGVVMTLEPRPPYTVNVTGDGSSVAVEVEWPPGESAS